MSFVFPEGQLVAREVSMINCTESTCPVSASPYGYRPSIAVNAGAMAIFVLSCIIFLIQGCVYGRKTLSFTLVLVFGTAFEAFGYAGRVMLWKNVFSHPGFKTQVIALTFAPALISAGIYFTLKHIVIAFGSRWSRIRPASYTYIFIGCDVLSILLQVFGAATAALADPSDHKKQDFGNDLMMGGVVFQVITLSIFAFLALDFAIRTKRNGTGQSRPSSLTRSTRFKLFLVALSVSFLAIYTRCCYRIADMSGGFSNPITHNQTDYIALETVMIVLASVVLNIFHPGLCFRGKKSPQNQAIIEAKVGSLSDSSSDDEWNATYHPRGPSMYPRAAQGSTYPRGRRDETSPAVYGGGA